MAVASGYTYRRAHLGRIYSGTLGLISCMLPLFLGAWKVYSNAVNRVHIERAQHILMMNGVFPFYLAESGKREQAHSKVSALSKADQLETQIRDLDTAIKDVTRLLTPLQDDIRRSIDPASKPLTATGVIS